jgi:hypothetical protein
MVALPANVYPAGLPPMAVIDQKERCRRQASPCHEIAARITGERDLDPSPRRHMPRWPSIQTALLRNVFFTLKVCRSGLQETDKKCNGR